MCGRARFGIARGSVDRSDMAQRPPGRYRVVKGWPRDAVARGIAFRQRVRDGVRRGEYRSEAEGIKALRGQVWGE